MAELIPRNNYGLFDFDPFTKRLFSMFRDYTAPEFKSPSDDYLRTETTNNEIIYELDIPGVNKEDVRLWWKNNQVYVSWQNRKHFNTLYRSYSWRLPSHADKNTTPVASLRNGVLQVRFARKDSEEESVEISISD